VRKNHRVDWVAQSIAREKVSSLSTRLRVQSWIPLRKCHDSALQAEQEATSRTCILKYACTIFRYYSQNYAHTIAEYSEKNRSIVCFQCTFYVLYVLYISVIYNIYKGNGIIYLSI